MLRRRPATRWSPRAQPGFPFFNLYRLAVIAAGRRLIASRAAVERAQSCDSNGGLGVRTVDETQHRGTQAGVPDDRGRAHARLTVTDASSPSAPAGRSTRRVDVDLVIRIVAALLAAGAICGLALTLYPDDLSVSTDILGYPIFRDFNSGRYTFEYLLIVVAFPAIAIAIFSALEVLARRRVGRRAVPGLPTVAVTDASTPIPTRGRSRRGVLRQAGRRRSPDRGDDRDRWPRHRRAGRWRPRSRSRSRTSSWLAASPWSSRGAVGCRSRTHARR